jgi:hypothetical protein
MPRPIGNLETGTRKSPNLILIVWPAHVVGDLLESDGTPKDETNRMLKQLPDLLTQLEWMALAMKRQRDDTGTF